jgi:hypothetical protein
MATIPFEMGFCPERWRQTVYIMFEKIPGIARTKKLIIIQLLKVDLNQVMRAASARNITNWPRIMRESFTESILGGRETLSLGYPNLW